MRTQNAGHFRIAARTESCFSPPSGEDAWILHFVWSLWWAWRGNVSFLSSSLKKSAARHCSVVGRTAVFLLVWVEAGTLISSRKAAPFESVQTHTAHG